MKGRVIFLVFSILIPFSAFAAGGLTWSGLLLGFLEQPLARMGVDPLPILDMLLVCALLIIFAYIVGKPFRRAVVEPSGKLDRNYVVEFVIGGIDRFLSGIIRHGQGSRPVFALLATYAFFILSLNLSGLVPGFNPPTDQFNVTITLGVVVFVVTHYMGFKTHGAGYIKQFLGPYLPLAWLMFPIELISHCVRPLSLAIRLFGNMTGDHKVVVVFTSIFAVALPVPFMGLGVLVSVLQAFVFVLLSAIYFESAVSEPH